ncbi:hypothetical protein EGI26_20925 [Lacihabitans sp. CCS-44]|uniref:hypothetical protein n=1 Tax=Lacihabitans sp. CCS-44 TaxID=2487331 RepID=UPI0020CDAE17|nr:hypothetical protein [Lacihabitans sp. CCS-44]MCP9757634.1 hypothetical protein [Lacihabitans sp. CCS-44]
MKKITLHYKKIIDKTSTKNWERQVWEAAFLEYCMKAQFYDSDIQYPIFKDLILVKPEAQKLHYLTSLGCLGLIQRLNNFFPDIADTLGKRSVPFLKYDFKILNANFNKKDDFVVQLDFESTPLLYIESIADTLWLGLPDSNTEEKTETLMVKLQNNLMITTILNP